MNRKLFSSSVVFEIAWVLHDFIADDLDSLYEALLQTEALTIGHDNIFPLYCISLLSSVLEWVIQPHVLIMICSYNRRNFNQLVVPDSRVKYLFEKPFKILWSNITGSLAQNMNNFLQLISHKGMN